MSAGAVSTQEALQLVIAMHRLLRGLRKAAHVDAPHATQLVVLALLASMARSGSASWPPGFPAPSRPPP